MNSQPWWKQWKEDCSGFVFFEDLCWQLLLGLLDHFRLCLQGWYLANLWLFDLSERQVNLASWPFPSTAAMHLILVGLQDAECCLPGYPGRQHTRWSHYVTIPGFQYYWHNWPQFYPGDAQACLHGSATANGVWTTLISQHKVFSCK